MRQVKCIPIWEHSLAFEISTDKGCSLAKPLTSKFKHFNSSVYTETFRKARKGIGLIGFTGGPDCSITLRGTWYSPEGCGFIKSLLSFNQTRYDASITLLMVTLFYSFLQLKSTLKTRKSSLLIITEYIAPVERFLTCRVARFQLPFF